MERYCSTGQSPQRAVTPTEEEEEEEECHMKEESNKRETGDVIFKSSCLIRGELPCDTVREI
jgi:hypothetical protein